MPRGFARHGRPIAPFAPRHKLPYIVTSSLRLDPTTDWIGFCTTFNFTGATDDEVTPATTRVPTLLLNAELDMQTQLSESRAAERFLLDVRHIDVPATDHWVLRRRLKCIAPIVNAFLEDASARLDPRCVDQIPIAPWITQ